MKNLLVRWLTGALALFILTQLHVGIECNNPVMLLLVVVALGFANAFIRPIIMFFAWPINCLTFGLFSFALNVIFFGIIGNGVVPGFHVGADKVSAPVAALIGTVGMSIISGLLNFFLKDRGDRDN